MPKKLPTWRIVVLRKTAEFVGTLEAADAKAAIRKAIEEFSINDSERRKRLLAQHVG
jgi:hypothetical protein